LSENRIIAEATSSISPWPARGYAIREGLSHRDSPFFVFPSTIFPFSILHSVHRLFHIRTSAEPAFHSPSFPHSNLRRTCIPITVFSAFEPPPNLHSVHRLFHIRTSAEPAFHSPSFPHSNLRRTCIPFTVFSAFERPPNPPSVHRPFRIRTSAEPAFRSPSFPHSNLRRTRLPFTALSAFVPRPIPPSTRHLPAVLPPFLPHSASRS